MTRSSEQIDWPPADSDRFVNVLCLFAEHLSTEELRGGLLSRIRAHGRSLLEQLERLILADRVADPDARATVVAALGWSGQASSTTAIRAALSDPSAQVLRAAARAAWFDLRQPQLVPRLTELLSQPEAEPDVAVAAAEALSHFRVPQALTPMVHLALNRSADLTDEEHEELLAAIERLADARFDESGRLTLRQRLGRLRRWWRQRERSRQEDPLK